MNGLDISLEEFRRLKPAARDEIIYKNLVHVRKQLKGVLFHRKVLYAGLIAGWMAIGFIIKILIGNG